MPLTYSIAYGLIGGIGTFIVLHLWDWSRELLVKLGVLKGEEEEAVGSNGVVHDHSKEDQTSKVLELEV
ncbi:hypothetical protein ABKV19_024294 [Rosa sericea]